MKVQIHTEVKDGSDLSTLIDEFNLESVEAVVDYDVEAVIFTIK